MKKRNSAFRNKLRNYSILAGSALATAGTADGQIIYHNLNPDVVLNTNGESLKLDLNGNGEPDFTLQVYQSAFNEAEIAPSYATSGNSYNAIGGSVKKVGLNKFAFPQAYVSGRKIGPEINWFNLSAIVNTSSKFFNPAMAYVKGTFQTGNWVGASNKFLALKVVVRSSNQTDSLAYYGWARCSVSSDAKTLTVYDYAYQSISDSAIIAGDTGSVTRITDHSLQNVSVFSSGKNIYVKYPGAHEMLTIVVRDMTGKEIRAAETANDMYELNLAGAAAGVYTVTVRNQNAEVTKKVSIQ